MYISCVARKRRRFKFAVSIYPVLLRKEDNLKLRCLYIMCCSGKKKFQSCGVYISCVAQERRIFKVAVSIYHVLLRKEEDLKLRCLYIMCCSGKKKI